MFRTYFGATSFQDAEAGRTYLFVVPAKISMFNSLLPDNRFNPDPEGDDGIIDTYDQNTKRFSCKLRRCTHFAVSDMARICKEERS